MSLQLKIPFFAIGDQVSISAIPEAYFKATGERLFYDDERIWVFKYNPFIDFREKIDGDLEFLVFPDSRILSQVNVYTNRFGTYIMGSQTEFVMSSLNLSSVGIRNPKLYVYENEKISPSKVVVHTTGSDRTLLGEEAIRYASGEDHVRVMSDEVIEAIKLNYEGWEVVQIGSKTDKPMGGAGVVDLRGKLDLWGTVREIASASRFIGVNSGPMHIANCYPRVVKRIVLMEFSEAYLSGDRGRVKFPLRAGDLRNPMTSWLDPNCTYFNRFNFDIGATNTYLNI